MVSALLRLPAVQARTGLSRSTIYRFIAEGSFPKPVLLGGRRAVGWPENHVQDWITLQVEQSQKAAA